jgi:signal-transduction protein with cAMP-binding, CBS, and nucleotidyltransferase domain
METNSKTAKDVADIPVILVDGLISAREAVEIMKEKNVEVLIIEKRNDDDAYGIVVLHDIIRGVVAQNKTLDEVSVYEIMRKPVVAIPHYLNKRYVSRFLVNLGLNFAPVDENGTFTGVISLKNFLMNHYD